MNVHAVFFFIAAHPIEFALGYEEGLDDVGMTYDGDSASSRSTAYDLGRSLRRGMQR
jgi:hypothetical protein